jgi:tripartite-type tricarboxylate transporter receptor subunit TctC
MKELGYTSFVIENWYGIFVASKTPSVLITRLNKAINTVMKEPDVAASLNKMGSSDVAGTSEQFTQFINKEIPYWESLVKRTGATVD